MIKCKDSLKQYLEADKIALCRYTSKPGLGDLIWQFEIALRHTEYYSNINRSIINNIFLAYWKFKFKILGLICGFEIPINVFGKGLSIAHKGTIIVNDNAIIGENCRIHTCVNIGTLPGVGTCAPIIGNNVYIGPGAKIYGPIHIASGIMIGANAVVGRDFLTQNVCIAGVPAKVISELGRFEVEENNRKKYSK